MRGKQLSQLRDYKFKFITPAHAGKTKLTAAVIMQAEDHPRACGENIARRMSERHSVGSPPRMRGKHLR